MMLSASDIEQLMEGARSAFEQMKWQAAVDYFTTLHGEIGLHATEITDLIISLVKLDQYDEASGFVSDEMLSDRAHRTTLRRELIMPAIRASDLHTARQLTERIARIAPDDQANLGTLATILMRQGDYAAAIEQLATLCRLDPENLRVRIQLLTSYLRTKQLEDAAAIAKECSGFRRDDLKLARLSAIALHRGGELLDACAAAIDIASHQTLDLEAAQIAGRIFLDCGQADEAKAVCGRAREAGFISPTLCHIEATSNIVLGKGLEETVTLLEQSLQQDPDHIPSLLLAGQVLFEDGQVRSAVSYLRRATERAPGVQSYKLRLGRCLMLANQPAAAADTMIEALKMGAVSERWKRLAVSALSQANRMHEAEALFAEYLDEKRRSLPLSIDVGIENLESQLDRAAVSQKRLDWMWTFLDKIGLVPPGETRNTWEDKVKWGYLADKLIQDWLECNPTEAEQVAALFVGMDEAKQRLADLMKRKKGLLLASAHIGPIFVGPLAMSLLRIDHNWVAHLPSVSPEFYLSNMVSTSDQSGVGVISQVYTALEEGRAVVIAVDGVSGAKTRKIEFEGLSIPHSDFLARMSYRMKVPSVFVAPYWCDGKIRVLFEELPNPADHETRLEFVNRWNSSYLSMLKNCMSLGAENLGTAGGIWSAAP